MSIITSVRRISHVALKTPNIEQQTAFYSDIVGLGETERDSSGRVYLRCNSNHHAIVLVPSTGSGIDHYALDLGSPVEWEKAANALTHAGITFETNSGKDPGEGPSLRLQDPDGYVIKLIGGMEQVSPNYGPRAAKPKKLSHATLMVNNCKRTAEFYQEVLGFRISDWVDDFFLWMRCNPDHHSLAFANADSPRMHHVAFELTDLSYLVQQAEHLMRNGRTLLYGPGRHGPGQNQFEYFRDPEQNLVEFMCDPQQIWNEDTYVPRVWNSKEPWVNLWGPEPPSDFV